MNNVGDVLEALELAISAADGTGDYTYDLSAANAVAIGVVESPPTNPHVSILPYVSGPADPGNTLDAVTVTWTLVVLGRVSASTDSELARFKAAADLRDDILTAIAQDRSLTGTCRDVVPGQEELGATIQGELPGYGWCLIPFEIEIKRGYVG